MRVLILLCAWVVSACSQSLDEQAECPSSGELIYEDVALATEAGDSTFALTNDCAYFVSGPEAYYKAVQTAWKKSPYQGGVRPIFLSATGRIEARENLASVFRIISLKEVSFDFTSDAARDQFQLRMARDPEK